MKSYKIPYIVSAAFGGVGLVLWIIVICEKLFNSAVSPTWVKPMKVWGLIALAIALAILIAIVIVAYVQDKKTSQTVQQSDDEILSKYKSKKNK
ncbi:MAG: hypothetical protein K6E74_04160 [Bacilli bacterium]|nr:hypothetical protein [Bacilli bacterium]